MKKVTMMGPEGLQGLMAAFADSQDDAPQTHPIDERAQAMELRDRFRRAQITPALKPGMFCREKRGMTILKTERLILFWRWLDPADTQDELIIANSIHKKIVNRTDCMVGFLDHDGNLCVSDYESWRLEPCDAFPEDAPE
jgi:hypothetical protein